MITEIILNMMFTPVSFMINFFPALVIPTDLIGSLAGFVELLAVSSYFIPIGVFQLCIIVFVAFHGMEFIISIVNWVISKIPTIS